MLLLLELLSELLSRLLSEFLLPCEELSALLSSGELSKLLPLPEGLCAAASP